MATTQAIAMTGPIISKEYTAFLDGLKERVSQSRYKAARAVNNELILLYHHIGTEILQRQEQQGWGLRLLTSSAVT